MTSLKNIADIRLGYQLRGRVHDATGGGYRILQIKDIGEDDRPKIENLMRVKLDDVKSEHLLRRSDILFISRGSRNRAALIDEDLLDTIAGAQFFIIRPRSGIIPEFLAWFINQKPAQDFIAHNTTGSNIRQISKEAFSRLPVVVPSIETQEKIARIHQLSREEKRLSQEIQRLRNKLTEIMLLEALQEKETP